MSTQSPVRLYRKPSRRAASLVVVWREDAGLLGPNVLDYLINKLKWSVVAEIDPAGFFPLGGVSVENDVAKFPESRFFSCRGKPILMLGSDQARGDWHRFAECILEVAEYSCRLQDVYTIGGMVTLSAHTTPRQVVTVASSPEMKSALSHYSVAQDMDYETPPGQRPTMSSLLLWCAQRRGIPAAALWVPIPFYLAGIEDPSASRTVLQFLDERLGLGLDLSDLDAEVAGVNEKLARLRSRAPDIDNCIQKLESNLTLSQEESETLVEGVQEFLHGDA